PGSNSEEQGTLYPGHAELPEPLRKAVAVELQRDRLDPAQVLESLTATRRQTAMEADGVPSQGSLRAMRVVLRETPFVARLDVYPDPDEVQQAVLAASVLGLRRAGTGRNRGRGRLSVTLSEGGHDVTASWFQRFQTLLGGSVA
ncbi:MAG: RAMP superfamily CRISPR-associated protein, partial [bacterium]